MAENNYPKISILMTSYNYESYIENAVRSVWNQKYANTELIVVDDGSKDGSRTILNKLLKISPINMLVIEQDNAGPSKALRRALENATGEIIGFLSSDDEMLPERLIKESEYFRRNSSLKVLYSTGKFLKNNHEFGNVHKKIEKYLKQGIKPIRNLVMSTAPGFYNQAMLINHEFLKKIGGLEDGTDSDDWSLNIRIFQSLSSDKEFIYLERNAFLYRIHGNQIHKKINFMEPMKRKVVRKYFVLENRSKYVCESFVKIALRKFFLGEYKIAYRYIIKMRYISHSNGFPLECLINYILRFPGFIIREFFRKFVNHN